MSGVSLLHRTVYMPPRKGEKAAEVPLLASPLPFAISQSRWRLANRSAPAAAAG